MRQGRNLDLDFLSKPLLCIVRPHFPDFFLPCKCQVTLDEMKSSFRNAMQSAWVSNQSFQEIHMDVSRGKPSLSMGLCL